MDKRVSLVIKAIAVAVIFVSTLLTIYAVGPWIETTYFPVVEKLQIERMEAGEDPNTTVVYAAFKKIRGCEYVGTSWFRGDRSKEFERVPFVPFRRPGDLGSPNRPLGFQRAGPWVIYMPLEEFETGSWAILFHKCHALWTTTTEFYP